MKRTPEQRARRAREVTLVKTLRRLLRETSGGTQPCNADVVKAARKVLK